MQAGILRKYSRHHIEIRRCRCGDSTTNLSTTKLGEAQVAVKQGESEGPFEEDRGNQDAIGSGAKRHPPRWRRGQSAVSIINVVFEDLWSLT